MDIARAGNNQYRIKVKKGFVVAKVGNSIEIQSSTSKLPFVITEPGEYEVDGISVFAYQAGATLAGVIHVEDLKVLTVASTLSDALIEEQGTIDVVIVNTDEMPNKDSVVMIGKIEPSCVIPSGEASAATAFVKDFEHTARETNKLSITRATLNSDITDVVILTD